jgi:hypothetical protein
MRTIPANIIAKLESNQIISSHLLTFEVDGTSYYYTDCPYKVYSDAAGSSQMYEPRGFKFESINYSNNNIVDNVSIEIDNIDSALTSIFLDNVIIEEPAAIYLVIFDDDKTILNTQVLFNGILNDFILDESKVSTNITSEFTKWDQNSNVKHSSLCRWKEFKGAECLYAGGQTACDRTYSRCIELSNTVNFGGFRWLPGIEDIQIWWGPTPTLASVIRR